MALDQAVLRTLGAIDGMADVLAGAHHVDVKTVVGRVSLRRFLAGFLGYQPRWLRWLYQARGFLARILGLSHETPADLDGLTPGDVPMTPGRNLKFLTVAAASEDRHWIAFAEDRHLCGWICVLSTPQANHTTRFDVATVVAYRHWTGPVYFNLIRPFHHLVVACMARAGAKG